MIIMINIQEKILQQQTCLSNIKRKRKSIKLFQRKCKVIIIASTKVNFTQKMKSMKIFK
jgi:hypothetical protein